MITTILTILGLIYFKFKEPINLFVSNKLIIKRRKEKQIKDLISHDVFNTFFRVRQEVKVLKFYTDGEFDPIKTKMCKDFTNYKVDVCSKYFKNLLIRDDLKYKSIDELKTIISKDLIKMHEEYISQIRQHWIDKKIKPNDVDYVVDLFEVFRHDVTKSFHHRIDSIFASSYYDSHFSKIAATLDMIAMGIDLLPKDLKNTFEALNGKFKKIKYWYIIK